MTKTGRKRPCNAVDCLGMQHQFEHGASTFWLCTEHGEARAYEFSGLRQQRDALLTVCKEFVEDVNAVGPTAVDEHMQWPDLVATYERAKAAIKSMEEGA